MPMVRRFICSPAVGSTLAWRPIVPPRRPGHDLGCFYLSRYSWASQLFIPSRRVEKWAERVSERRQRGKSAEEFAESRGFEGSTLRYWSSRLKH
jgi:hypothetical protein